MNQGPSMAKISSVKAGKAVAILQPVEIETGWLPTLVDGVKPNEDCLVIPCHGTYGQGLIIPYSIRLPRLGTIQSVSPVIVESSEVSYTCKSVLQLSVDAIGREALIVPVINPSGETEYLLAGVIQ